MPYWAASKLPASVTDSIHFYSTGTSNILQLFQSMLKGIVFSFRFGFFELYGTASHTMVWMQERGHMHIDDIVRHADKFQVTLCSQKWKAHAFLTRWSILCVCARVCACVHGCVRRNLHRP